MEASPCHPTSHVFFGMLLPQNMGRQCGNTVRQYRKITCNMTSLAIEEHHTYLQKFTPSKTPKFAQRRLSRHKCHQNIATKLNKIRSFSPIQVSSPGWATLAIVSFQANRASWAPMISLSFFLGIAGSSQQRAMKRFSVNNVTQIFALLVCDPKHPCEERWTQSS